VNPITNPFTPNAGERPDVLAGRDELIANFEVLLARTLRGRAARSMIITGLRGVGKTVLLARFRDIALAEGWSVVEREAVKHDEEGFRREMAMLLRAALLKLAPRARWTDRFQRAAGALTAFSVTVDPDGKFKAGLRLADIVEGVADHGDLNMDLTDVLVSVGEATKKKGTGVLLLIDEIQFLRRPHLEAPIMALHKTVQRSLPVVLVGAGLPQIPELTGDAKSYAERLFTFPIISNLNVNDAKEALQGPAEFEDVSFTPEAIRSAYQITEGYPFFIQELGSAAWITATSSPITAQDIAQALDLYLANLDTSFFRVRLNRASSLQSAYLRAMAELGPGGQRTSDVAALLNRDSTRVASTRKELMEMGLLYTPSHGVAAFTVPHFDQYLKRAVPEFMVPEPRAKG
jgi:hypothetical protein